MHLSDSFAMHAALKELTALEALWRGLDIAYRASRHPDLALVDVPDIDDALAEVLTEIDEHKQALSDYRECDVREMRHNASLLEEQS